VVAEGVHVSADDEQKAKLARVRLAAPSGLLGVHGAYQGNADAWEALWLADEAIGAVGDQELAELSAAEPRRAFRE
jgi:hypothetical protein